MTDGWDEREAFEAWRRSTMSDWIEAQDAALSKELASDGKTIRYPNSYVEAEWRAWQAARASAAPLSQRKLASKSVEQFADHAEECTQPIGLTTCGYPRAHIIHNNKASMSYHDFSGQPQLTQRQVHEEAAGMGLCPEFFDLNGINPDAPASQPQPSAGQTEGK